MKIVREFMQTADACIIVKKSAKKYLGWGNGELKWKEKQGDAIAFASVDELYAFLDNVCCDDRNNATLGKKYGMVPLAKTAAALAVAEADIARVVAAIALGRN